MSAKNIYKNDKENEFMGAISHLIENLSSF